MRGLQAFVSLALVSVLAAGCGSNASSKKASSFDAAGEFAKVKQARNDLTAAREESNRIKGELDGLKQKPRPAAEDQAKIQELEAQLKAAQKHQDEMFNADQDALSAFLNTTLNDEQLRATPETKQALELYADEAVHNAHEFIDESGDYRRAIELLQNAQQYFEYANAPVPEALSSTLEHAKEFRYLIRERFDQVKKGMSAEDVKTITGTPYYMNVRETDTKNGKVTSWLFNREDGGAAAVYFLKGKVYSTEWDVKQHGKG